MRAYPTAARFVFNCIKLKTQKFKFSYGFASDRVSRLPCTRVDALARAAFVAKVKTKRGSDLLPGAKAWHHIVGVRSVSVGLMGI